MVSTEVRALADQSEKAVMEIHGPIAGGKARIERLDEIGTTDEAVPLRTAA